MVPQDPVWFVSQDRRRACFSGHVYANACHSAGQLKPFDGTVQGLVDALDAQVSTDASVTDVTVGGQPAKRIELIASEGVDLATCRYGAGSPLQIWADPAEAGFFTVGSGFWGVVHALDIQGKLVVFTAAIGPAASATDLAELEAIVASVQFMS